MNPTMKYEWCPVLKNVRLIDPWRRPSSPKIGTSRAWGLLRSAEATPPRNPGVWWSDLQGGGLLEGLRGVSAEERQAFRGRVLALRDPRSGEPSFRLFMKVFWEGGPIPGWNTPCWEPLHLHNAAKPAQVPVLGWTTPWLWKLLRDGPFAAQHIVKPASGGGIAPLGVPLPALFQAGGTIRPSDYEEGSITRESGSWMRNFLPRVSLRAEIGPHPLSNWPPVGSESDISSLGMRAPWAAAELALWAAHSAPTPEPYNVEEGQRLVRGFDALYRRRLRQEDAGGAPPISSVFPEWVAEAFPYQTLPSPVPWSEALPRFFPPALSKPEWLRSEREEDWNVTGGVLKLMELSEALEES